MASPGQRVEQKSAVFGWDKMSRLPSVQSFGGIDSSRRAANRRGQRASLGVMQIGSPGFIRLRRGRDRGGI